MEDSRRTIKTRNFYFQIQISLKLALWVVEAAIIPNLRLKTKSLIYFEQICNTLFCYLTFLSIWKMRLNLTMCSLGTTWKNIQQQGYAQSKTMQHAKGCFIAVIFRWALKFRPIMIKMYLIIYSHAVLFMVSIIGHLIFSIWNNDMWRVCVIWLSV